MSAEPESSPPISLPHPIGELNGASIAYIEHRNCEMVRELGKLIATEDRLIIETTSLSDDPYHRIARSFILTQAQADSIRKLPETSVAQWECGMVLSGNN
jgi:hypothetical protein